MARKTKPPAEFSPRIYSVVWIAVGILSFIFAFTLALTGSAECRIFLGAGFGALSIAQGRQAVAGLKAALLRMLSG